MPSSYPFDPTGLAESNFIRDEPQILTEVNDDTYRLFIPEFAPFYQDNLRIVYYDEAGGIVPLTNGIDYTLVMPFIAASRSIGKNLFGAISVHTKLVQGHLGVDYRTIGSPWVGNKSWVLEQLVQKLYNPRVVYWDQVTDVQQTFPPVNHPVDYDNIYGQRAVLDKMDELIAAIVAGPNPSSLLATHVLAKGNAHGLTTADLNLENVPNFPLASQLDLDTGAAVDKFISLKQLVQSNLIERLANVQKIYTDMSASQQAAVQAAQTAITASSIGLGLVENTPVASAIEVQGRDVIHKLITLDQLFPLLESIVPELATVDDLKLLIAQTATAAYEKALADAKLQITKKTLDLGDVSNLPIASPSDIADRADVNKYVLLSQVLKIMQEDVPQIVDVIGIYDAIAKAQSGAITASTSQITAASLGLDKVSNLPVATTAEVTALTPADKYVTLAQVLALFGVKTPDLTPVYAAIDTKTQAAVTQAVTQAVATSTSLVQSAYKPELLTASAYFLLGS